MPVSPEAQQIYRYVVDTVFARGTIGTYGEVSRATGVLMGPGGGHIGMRLGEIFHACDEARLPPLPVIIVRGGQDGEELYDQPRNRYGMPGPGYFVAEAMSPNRAQRRRDPGIERWHPDLEPPEFDRELARWEYRDMIHAHQDSVWGYGGVWPQTI